MLFISGDFEVVVNAVEVDFNERTINLSIQATVCLFLWHETTSLGVIVSRLGQ